ALVQRSEIRGSGPGSPGTYDVAHGHLFSLGDRRFPMGASLASPDGRVRIDLTWNDVEPGASLEPALFLLATPRGARVVDLPPGASIPPAPLVPPDGP
ncbi:MAG TPA: DUF4292 domain-containing protein, partial [Anaeromyxobacteraceae bacterium]|nr:DUF4292 domain-containing protein [Anaeromyxobacteraceae bacterium]